MKWSESPADFPVAESWALTVVLRGPGVLEVAAAPSGSRYDVTLSAAATARLGAGVYQAALVASKDAERYTVATWSLTVAADVPAADAGELTRFPEKLLPLVEQEILNRVGGQRSIERYTLFGRTFDKVTLRELYTLRGKLKAAIAAAQRPGMFGVPIGARFASAS